MTKHSAHMENETLSNNTDSPVALFAHGKESGPWGKKILALAHIAQSHGYAVESPDFTGMNNPEDRVNHLLQVASALRGPFVLAGSSMGGYVSLRVSQSIPSTGLFLMAPAVGLAGYQWQTPDPGCSLMTIVHAWQDEIIPASNVITYAERHHAELHMVNSDHRLSGQIPLLATLFESFLVTINERRCQNGVI